MYGQVKRFGIFLPFQEECRVDNDKNRTSVMISAAEVRRVSERATTFGFHSETRESQYDLLWLECVRELQMFIEMDRITAKLGPIPSPAY